jgi:cell shape-determining protein MreC
MIDKLSEAVFWLLGIIASIGAWVVNRLFGRLDTLEERVDEAERTLLTRENLEDSLEPLKNSNNLILSHLLEHRGTEYEEHKTKNKEI